MNPRPRSIIVACLALAAGMTHAQTVSRTTSSASLGTQPSGVSSGTSGAAGSAPGAVSAGGSIPLGTGTDGRTVIVVTQPAPGGTNTMGGAAAPRGPYTAVDVASMFMSADSNRDGELSRAEAQRLPLPMSFEDMDANHDGVISRSEFEEAFR